MKKSVAVLLCFAMLSSVILCGCNKQLPQETADTSETTGSETTETTEEPFTVTKQLDQDKLQQVADLYFSKVPDEIRAVELYEDGIRGRGSYYYFDDKLHFSYLSMDNSSVDLTFDTISESVSISFRLSYDEEYFYGISNSYRPGVTDIESFIDDLTAGKYDEFDVYDPSAIQDHKDDIKNDLPILYSRLIAFADDAFPELGFGLEDLGIDLGEKYRTVDPKQPASNETVIVNEHEFVEGVCSDCDITWTEYFYDVLGTMDKYSGEDEWHSYYGQETATEIPGIVQYSAGDGTNSDLFFYYTYDDWNEINCRVSVYSDDGEIYSNIRFSFEEGMYYVDTGVVSYKFLYQIEYRGQPGEFEKALESRESFEEYFDVYLFVFEDGVGMNVLDDMDEDEIAELFEEENCQFYTIEEFTDMIWESHEAMLTSLDKGMVWLDTSFADIGIKYR